MHANLVCVCVCVALGEAHAASELLAGNIWAHQPSLSSSFCLGEGGAGQERRNVGSRRHVEAEGSFSAFPLAWRPRSPRGRQRGRGFGSGRTRFGVWKDLVLVWKEVFGLEVSVAAVPLAVGVLDSVAEVKKLSPGSSRMVLVGL